MHKTKDQERKKRGFGTKNNRSWYNRTVAPIRHKAPSILKQRSLVMCKRIIVFWLVVAAMLSLQDKEVEGLKCDSSATLLYNHVGVDNILTTPRGGAAAAAALNPFPSGYNPFGYGLTELGKEFLAFDGSLDSDVGRFLSSLKSGKRKSAAVMKEQWLEVVRVSKQGQSMRIYRKLDELISFCLKAGFLD